MGGEGAIKETVGIWIRVGGYRKRQ